jgi:DNA-binding Xre family transcriptional regulator
MEGLTMVQDKPVARPRTSAFYVINVTEACRRRGIENAYQLWQKIGGSKSTAAQLFGGNSEMIRTETMTRLHRELGIMPSEYIYNEPE